MEYVASEYDVSIKCIDGDAYSFNGETSSIFKCILEIGETLVCLEGGLIR